MHEIWFDNCRTAANSSKARWILSWNVKLRQFATSSIPTWKSSQRQRVTWCRKRSCIWSWTTRKISLTASCWRIFTRVAIRWVWRRNFLTFLNYFDDFAELNDGRKSRRSSEARRNASNVSRMQRSFANHRWVRFNFFLAIFTSFSPQQVMSLWQHIQLHFQHQSRMIGCQLVITHDCHLPAQEAHARMLQFHRFES